MISLSHYLILGAILFAISTAGISLNRKNVIMLLTAIELMLLAVNMNFIAFSHYLGDIAGQVFVFFILTVAAAESAIGLAILVVLFRNLQTINVDDLDNLKGRHDGPAALPARAARPPCRGYGRRPRRPDNRALGGALGHDRGRGR